jgi:hypothetical protein
MPLDPQRTLRLVDPQGRCLGNVSIRRIEANRVFAEFSPAAEFARVEELFHDLEEAVNEQLFSLADRLSAEIDRLGLRLASADGSEHVEVCDAQIMNRRDLCLRIPNLALIQLPQTIAEAG